MVGFLIPGGVTLEAVKARIESGETTMIFFGGQTCWWTDKGDHLYNGHGLGPRTATNPLTGKELREEWNIPAGPRNEPLLEAHDPAKFIRQAEEAPSGYYGKHGLDAFMAAYHGNIVVNSRNDLPTSFQGWAEYNRIIDESTRT